MQDSHFLEAKCIVGSSFWYRTFPRSYKEQLVTLVCMLNKDYNIANSKYCIRIFRLVEE